MDISHYVLRFAWERLKDTIKSGIKEATDNLAKEAGNTVFFGFILETQLDGGTVYFSYGRCADALKLLGLPTDSAVFAEGSGFFVEDSPVWSPGDWRYASIDEQFYPKFEQAWQAIAADIVQINYTELYKIYQNPQAAAEFDAVCLQQMTRAVVEASKEGAFDAIYKTADFKVLCLEHDERLEEAWGRIKQRQINAE